MKKFNLLVITPILLGAVGTGVGISYQAVPLGETLSTEQITTLKSSFNNPYLLETNVELTYSEYKTGFKVRNQVASDYRMEEIYFRDQLLDTTRVVKGSAGQALEECLTIDNTVEERPLMDLTQTVSLKFDDNYGNPFRKVAKLKSNQFDSYFVVSEKNNVFTLKATELGYGILSNELSSFFQDFDGYAWDLSTLTYYIENFEMNLNADGTPTTINFTKVKKDRFGAQREYFKSTFTPLEEVVRLQPQEPLMNESEISTFETKVNEVQSKINGGNFTQSFNMFNGAITYNNFYDYDYQEGDELPPMMLSDLQLYDGSYGLTYIGMLETYEGYTQYAISPDAGYQSTMNSNFYETLQEVIPNLNAISSDFFFKVEEDVYAIDLASFAYDDDAFCAEILSSIATGFDPAVSQLGLYLSNFSYMFNSLIFMFQNDSVTIGLDYYYEGIQTITIITFSNFGTTNLLEEETIEIPINFFLSQM